MLKIKYTRSSYINILDHRWNRHLSIFWYIKQRFKGLLEDSPLETKWSLQAPSIEHTVSYLLYFTRNKTAYRRVQTYLNKNLGNGLARPRHFCGLSFNLRMYCFWCRHSKGFCNKKLCILFYHIQHAQVSNSILDYNRAKPNLGQ